MLDRLKFLLRLFIGFIFIYCFLYTYQSEDKFHYLTDLKFHVEQKLYNHLQLKFDQTNDECSQHQYTIRIIERSPLIIYIEKFLTQHEIDHVVQLAQSHFQPSMIHDDNGELTFDQARTSNSAFLKRAQTPIVNCLERRFAKFQGNIKLEHIEPFQVVRYASGQQYDAHFDWFDDSQPSIHDVQRLTTFFTYLEANCSTGGETEFIKVKFNRTLHGRFCDILTCDDTSEKHGIRFRPIPGNSIFWFNLNEHGQVDFSTFHAGRPPGENGYKIGLNTWTGVDDVTD